MQANVEHSVAASNSARLAEKPSPHSLEMIEAQRWGLSTAKEKPSGRNRRGSDILFQSCRSDNVTTPCCARVFRWGWVTVFELIAVFDSISAVG